MINRPTNEVLMDAVALAFPLGGISELTRRFSASYTQSYEAFKGDPRISEKDFKPLVGHLRRALINRELIAFSEQYPNMATCLEIMEGKEGHNNHVELVVGTFLITQHHQTKSDSMPENFVNLSSIYNQTNAELNEYVEPEWFSEKRVLENPKANLLNLLILHEKSREGLHQIGNIEFVFPKKSKKHIVLGVSDLVQKQSEIMDLDSEDLFNFKRRSADEIRRMIA